MPKSLFYVSRTTVFLLCSLLLSATMLGACGDSRPATLNTQALERAAAASVLAEHGVRARVSCPQGVPMKLGFRFWCTAQLDVGSYPLLVLETNAAGRVRYENSAPLQTLDVERVRQAIAQRVRSVEHGKASVRCPSTVLQHEGTDFECVAEAAGRRIEFVVRQLNDAGRVRFSARA